MNQDLRTFIKEKFREPEKAALPEFSGDTSPMVFIKKKVKTSTVSSRTISWTIFTFILS